MKRFLTSLRSVLTPRPRSVTPHVKTARLPSYTRGFLVADAGIRQPLPNFREVRADIPGIRTWVDSETEVLSATCGSCAVVVFGTVADTLSEDITPQDIALSLAESLCSDRKAFLTRIGTISGRYAVVAKDQDGSFAVGDAGGTRSIFYTTTGPLLVASHSKLIADLIDAKEIEIASNIQEFGTSYRARNWPGRLSKYRSVFSLTPNTYLDLTSREPRRFFPMQPLPLRTADEAADIVAPLLTTSVANFMHNYSQPGTRDILMFLTGGIDSRLIMSVIGKYSDRLTAYSYQIGEAHTHDIKVANSIAGRAGIPHIVHHASPSEFDPDVCKWADEAASGLYIGSKSVVSNCATLSNFNFAMRGNLGEISRGVFHARTAYEDQPARYMARVWYRGSERHKVIMDAFQDYAQAVEIEKAKWPLRILYYWEHKHATWHAGNLNELDVGFDTYNPLNSRNVIEAMCGVSLEDQKSSAVHRALIAKLDPDLLHFGVKHKTI